MGADDDDDDDGRTLDEHAERYKEHLLAQVLRLSDTTSIHSPSIHPTSRPHVR